MNTIIEEKKSLQEEDQYKEALLKYAYTYSQRRQKAKDEKDLLESKKYYVIYARKSTEDEKRQVQSIEDQINQCKKYAKSNKLEVVEILREEKSAKTAGRRDRFREMLDRINKGDLYNAILTWHPDRLARNMKESGEILDMLDNDIIKDLKFASFAFTNDAAGKMTLSILFAMAKEFSDKLSEDTKRGNRKKVKEGKYMGSIKKGYFKGKNDYFRRDSETFEIYQKAWEMYQKTNNQSKVVEWLQEQGEITSVNKVSEFFRDPFSAGFYCYGGQVVDLKAVDPNFTPMITPKDFITMQKMNRDNPRGWKISDEFRPFNDFVLCAHCGNPMTSGLSRGKSGLRYLNVTCGNKKCKEERKSKHLSPIANTIRGELILEFVIEGIKALTKVDKSTYDKVKKVYFAERSDLFKQMQSDITALKTKKTKIESHSKKIQDKLIMDNDVFVSKKLSEDLVIILKEIRGIDTDIELLEKRRTKYEYELELEFPPFEDFLNFFENALLVMDKSEDAYLIDQLTKLVFLNTTVDGKKVSEYRLREPFNEYENLKFLHGVVNGT